MFARELRNYQGVLVRHWLLILSIGLHFGWLLAFPLQGPLLGALAQRDGFDPQPGVALFLVGHIFGVVGAGIFGYLFRKRLVWFSLGAIPCIVISLAVVGLPLPEWLFLFALMGLFSGIAVISWGNAFASSVAPAQRGRTFALSAVLANVIVLAINSSGGSATFSLVFEITSVLPLAMPLALYLGYRRASPDAGGSVTKEPADSRMMRLKCWPALPFIFAINVVGGLMYVVVGSISSPPTGLFVYYGLVPYIVLLFLAGSLADTVGRRSNAFVGAITVGIGFMLVGVLRGPLQYVGIQTLLVGGIAFIDTFIWVTAADLSGRRWAPLSYAAILGTNLLAILAGMLLGRTTGELATGSEVLTVSLAGLFTFLSLTFIARLVETSSLDQPVASHHRCSSLQGLAQRSRFTPRESEVAKLLISGASTQEIRATLVIAPDTLKSHLRNIYRKVGVRNRLEFTIVVGNLDGKTDGQVGRAELEEPVA